MLLQLAHHNLDVSKVSKDLVITCYKLAQSFPAEEKFALAQQIKRAAVSVHLNIAEGCSRKSQAERNRFFEIARGSLVEIDTAFDIAVDLHYVTQENIAIHGKPLIRCFQMLSKMINP